VASQTFTLNSGKKVKGQFIIDLVKNNKDSIRLWNAFNDKFGEEVANTAAISLFYENGRLDPLFRGVCNEWHAENRNTYRCVYADVNTDGGMDAGLKSINVWWHRDKIKEMSNGSITCNLKNKETAKSYKIACTKEYVDWLHNIDNSIALAIRIYEESGNSFVQWYGYRRGFNK
jgi:hypothetical protein